MLILVELTVFLEYVFQSLHFHLIWCLVVTIYIYGFLYIVNEWEWNSKQQEQQRKEETQLMYYDPRQAFCFLFMLSSKSAQRN